MYSLLQNLAIPRFFQSSSSTQNIEESIQAQAEATAQLSASKVILSEGFISSNNIFLKTKYKI